MCGCTDQPILKHPGLHVCSLTSWLRSKSTIIAMFLIRACLLLATASQAAVLPPASNNSVLTLPGHQLGAWPSQLPWELPITDDLSVEFISYGHTAPRTWWTEIDRGMKYFADQMRMVTPNRDVDFRTFQTQYVLFLLNDLADSPWERRDAKLSRADAAV
ncbi:MAG: hypothetical protein Q9174_006547, partial [Haloplaca sp. 1 TL-2023]